ncbi:SDR family NAD(P)-dependent oxidoreductase, partial [Pseudomonas aeruginosa]
MTLTVMNGGCGDVGGGLGEAVLADGWRVHGRRRSVDAVPQGNLPVAGELQAPECPA